MSAFGLSAFGISRNDAEEAGAGIIAPATSTPLEALGTAMSWDLDDEEFPSVPSLTGEAAVLGRDILFELGQIVATPNGDYKTVEGTMNFRLALRRRLLTRKRGFRVRPEYGVGAGTYVKQLQSQRNLDALAGDVEENFEQDPRTEKVLSAVFGEKTDATGEEYLQLDIAVQATGRRLHYPDLDVTANEEV